MTLHLPNTPMEPLLAQKRAHKAALRAAQTA
jgi:hypothetical protein